MEHTVGDTGALNGKEGEDECQHDREQAHADRHVELNTHDHADEDDHEEEEGCPPPPLDHFLGLGGVLDQVVFLLLRSLFQVWVIGAVLLLVQGVELLAAGAVDSFADEPEDL